MEYDNMEVINIEKEIADIFVFFKNKKIINSRISNNTFQEAYKVALEQFLSIPILK
jgi:hypothetical protein